MTEGALKHLIKENGSNFAVNEFNPAGQGIASLKRPIVDNILGFRAWSGLSMLLTSLYRDGDDGAHGQGLAGDFILFEKWLETLADPWTVWTLATTWPFQGVGIYFDWSFTDKDGNRRTAVGIHADLLPPSKGSRPLRWIAKKVDGKRHYFYQRPDGLFYASGLSEPITLYSAVRQYEKL